ncbi:hypothetical protein NDI39_26960 [Microcoleus sp. ZQ-A2]|nr:hypothetical protein [Microcoleus sp. FACHB-1]
MPIIIGSILFGAFAITAAIVEGDWQSEPTRLTSKKKNAKAVEVNNQS